MDFSVDEPEKLTKTVVNTHGIATNGANTLCCKTDTNFLIENWFSFRSNYSVNENNV